MSPKEAVQVPSVLKDNSSTSLPQEDAISSLGIKYPTGRDHPLHTGHLWLCGKQADDGAEKLWRIHDCLYDLKGFEKVHPGGKSWIEVTEGTDITEAFESHHLSDLPEKMLPDFFVRKATTPRNYPFTFESNGFYKTLKRNIIQELKTIPMDGADRSKYLTDFLMFSYVSLFILAVYFNSFSIGFVSGILLSLTTVAAHNFFHQRDNFRMFYFDFSLMASSEWRISHALSHHMYTNTINDLEISAIEPFLQYLPIKKMLFFKYVSWLYSPIFYVFMFFGHFIKSLIQTLILGKFVSPEIILPFTIPVLAFLLTRESILFCSLMFLWIETVASTYFGLVGVNAAHHHPDIFHDGDTPRENLDWGLFQMDAVMDRKDITGSHFLVLTNFGDHALHHLFPTIDHGLLEHLYPVFLKTCDQFGVEWRLSSQIELVKGQYRQLAREIPNKIAPSARKKLQ